MKITDPITSIDIKTETLSSHDTPGSYQRCGSPRFVPSDSVPFSLRQSLLELLLGFVNFDFTFQKLQTAHLQIPHVKKKFPVY
jgi:hypothetical protein